MRPKVSQRATALLTERLSGELLLHLFKRAADTRQTIAEYVGQLAAAHPHLHHWLETPKEDR